MRRLGRAEAVRKGRPLWVVDSRRTASGVGHSAAVDLEKVARQGLGARKARRKRTARRETGIASDRRGINERALLALKPAAEERREVGTSERTSGRSRFGLNAHAQRLNRAWKADARDGGQLVR